jgi:PPOX class probable F420-dependent enzyme
VTSARPAQPESIPADVRDFLAAPRFAVISTINPDGSAHQAVVWYLLEGDEIVVNSREGRRWPSNLRRDPRLSVAVHDGADWVGLRGQVAIVDDQPTAQADIAAMARRYDDPADAEAEISTQFRHQQRVSFRLRATAIHTEFGGE